MLSATSCFAPRVPDDIPGIAALCKEHDIPHVVNNAYGLQCTKITESINAGLKIRVDCIVSSTDKNFMVPVGGGIIYTNSKMLLSEISQLYPGRASAAPYLDFFITMLSIGSSGFKSLLKARKDLIPTFKAGLEQVAAKHGQRLLFTPGNTISYAITVSQGRDLGSMLFYRRVMGTRVVALGATKTIGNVTLDNFESSNAEYPVAYMTAACSIGLT